MFLHGWTNLHNTEQRSLSLFFCLLFLSLRVTETLSTVYTVYITLENVNDEKFLPLKLILIMATTSALCSWMNIALLSCNSHTKSLIWIQSNIQHCIQSNSLHNSSNLLKSIKESQFVLPKGMQYNCHYTGVDTTNEWHSNKESKHILSQLQLHNHKIKSNFIRGKERQKSHKSQCVVCF